MEPGFDSPYRYPEKGAVPTIPASIHSAASSIRKNTITSRLATLHAAHNERCVIAAEGERCRYPTRDRHLPSLVRDEVDIAFGIAFAEADGRRHDTACDRQREGRRLDR